MRFGNLEIAPIIALVAIIAIVGLCGAIGPNILDAITLIAQAQAGCG